LFCQKKDVINKQRGRIPSRRDIEQRSAIVHAKNRIGGLEIDLVVGKNYKGALVSINDRATGMLKVGYISNKSASEVKAK